MPKDKSGFKSEYLKNGSDKLVLTGCVNSLLDAFTHALVYFKRKIRKSPIVGIPILNVGSKCLKNGTTNFFLNSLIPLLDEFS